MAYFLVAACPLSAEEKIKLRRSTDSAEAVSTGSSATDAPSAPASTASPASAPKSEGKIKLTRPDAPTASTPASTQEGEYTTSRGPESRPRTIYLGPYLGFNVGGAADGFSASQNANGWDIYPILGLRGELYSKRVYGIITDLGYEQNKTYVKETPTGTYAGNGLLRTDFITLRSMLSYRYSLYKVFSKVKFMRPIADAFKPVAGNLQAGFFLRTPLSAQLELLDYGVGDPNDPFYDVKQFTRSISGGLMAGLGFELRLGAYIFFFDGQYFRGLLDTYDGIKSRYFNTDSITHHGIYFSSGLKTAIYGF